MNTKHIKERGTLQKTIYEPPKITTYAEEEILELIGPANTCGSPGLHEPHGHAWGWRRRHR